MARSTRGGLNILSRILHVIALHLAPQKYIASERAAVIT